jgi:membrane protein implicated in regulation of membrane protease activity
VKRFFVALLSVAAAAGAQRADPQRVDPRQFPADLDPAARRPAKSGSPVSAARSASLFDEANAAYLAGDLPRASASYEALLQEGIASAEVETNLGATYLREGKRGLAALHLERALFLDPGDDDARADLSEARRGAIDRLEGETEGREVLTRLLSPLPGRPAAIALLVAWTAAWGLLAGHLLRPRRLLVPFSFAAFGLSLLLGLVTAGAAVWHGVALRRAVIVAPSIPAREGPSERTTTHFEVHEGTAVRVEDEEDGFRRIKLANGLVGWVPSGAVELVVPPGWAGQNG